MTKWMSGEVDHDQLFFEVRRVNVESEELHDRARVEKKPQRVCEPPAFDMRIGNLVYTLGCRILELFANHRDRQRDVTGPGWPERD